MPLLLFIEDYLSALVKRIKKISNLKGNNHEDLERSFLSLLYHV